MTTPRSCKRCSTIFTPPATRRGQMYCTRECYSARTPQIERDCPGCGVKWSAPQSNPSRYCTKACLEQHNGWQRLQEASCEQCGTQFMSRFRHDERGWQKYCCQQCAAASGRTMESRDCASCGNKFEAHPSTDNRCCSWQCRNDFYRLSRAPSWNGGVYFTGEIKRVKLDRPGYAAKYEAEYRLIAGRAIGRPLVRGEVVIHLDRDRTNNDPTNLFICGSQSEHAQRRGGKRLPWPTESNLSTYNRDGYCASKAGLPTIDRQLDRAIRTAHARSVAVVARAKDKPA